MRCRCSGECRSWSRTGWSSPLVGKGHSCYASTPLTRRTYSPVLVLTLRSWVQTAPWAKAGSALNRPPSRDLGSSPGLRQHSPSTQRKAPSRSLYSNSIIRWPVANAAGHRSISGGTLSHRNAALTPRHRLRVARLVVEEGWPISEVAARFQVSWPTVKRWVDRRADPPIRTRPPWLARARGRQEAREHPRRWGLAIRRATSRIEESCRHSRQAEEQVAQPQARVCVRAHNHG